MTAQEKYLALYKEYESLVRDKGLDPKDIEEKADTTEGKRLQMCRQFRNYYAHVPDPGFLAPTERMLRFLQEKVDYLKAEGDTAKKHMKKPEVILTHMDKVSDAMERFSKFKRTELLFQEKDGSYALISVFSILGAKGAAKLDLFKKTKVKPVYCGPMDSFAGLDPGKVTLCTDDGTAMGKLLGQIWF